MPACTIYITLMFQINWVKLYGLLADSKNEKVIQLLVQDIYHVRLTLPHTTICKHLSNQMPVLKYTPFSLFTEKNSLWVLSENFKHFLGGCCIASFLFSLFQRSQFRSSKEKTRSRAGKDAQTHPATDIHLASA